MNDKLLAEYCGLCLHDWVELPRDACSAFYTYICSKCGIDYEIAVADVDYREVITKKVNFSTPEDYELLHTSINERSGWYELYEYITELHYSSGDMLSLYISARNFHELTCAEKSPLVSEWLEKRR